MRKTAKMEFEAVLKLCAMMHVNAGREVDDWLRGQKGYGAFSLGTSERRLFAVGDCYYLGAGVEKDLEAAAEWYQKALDAGYEPDEEDQKHLAEVMGSK